MFLGLAWLALALERGRERAAAAAWCLPLIKPNIIVLAIIGMPVLRSRRFLGYAVAFALLILLASLAMVPTWPAGVLRVIFGQQLLVDRDLGTLSALAIVLGLPSLVGIAAAAVALRLRSAAAAPPVPSQRAGRRSRRRILRHHAVRPTA